MWCHLHLVNSKDKVLGLKIYGPGESLRSLKSLLLMKVGVLNTLLFLTVRVVLKLDQWNRIICDTQFSTQRASKRIILSNLWIVNLPSK